MNDIIYGTWHFLSFGQIESRAVANGCFCSGMMELAMNLEISNTVMAMFSDYESRPITRKAILIDESMVITKINGESTWELKVKNCDASLLFKAYIQPVVGDYIVHVKDDDVYHVDAVTFAERSIIPADIEAQGPITTVDHE